MLKFDIGTISMLKAGWIPIFVLAAWAAMALPSAAQNPSAPESGQAPRLDNVTPRFRVPGQQPGEGPLAGSRNSDDKDDDDDDDDDKDSVDPSMIFTRLFKLNECGLTLDGTMMIDENYNMVGGKYPNHGAAENLITLGFTQDLEKTCGLKGGSLYMLMQSKRGTNAQTFVGDEQYMNNMDATLATVRGQIGELWYQQYFFEKKLRVKIGKVDANEEFAFVTNGLDFLHGAFGNATTIQWLPTYPDQATSINLFAYPNDKLYMGAAIYDGTLPLNRTTGRRGPDSFFDNPKGAYFYVGEAGVNYKLFGEDELDGRLGVGYWYNTAPFIKFSRLKREFFLTEHFRRREITRFETETQKGTGGPYVVLDQRLWKENEDDKKDKQGIIAFYQFGYGDPEVNLFQIYHGTGIAWTGFQRGRDDDEVGFGIAFSKFSDDPRAFDTRRNRILPDPHPANEIAYQWFYKYKYNDHWQIMPNLTWVHDPGTNKALKDSVIWTFRFILDF